jgi:HAD superfamily hydrolase (TIGR01509 family)
MNRIQAVIFDVDGTLVDSNHLHVLCWQETFRHFGKDIPLEALFRQVGKGSDQYMPVFWSEKELRHIGTQMAAFREQLFLQKYLRQAKPFPKAKELLERLHQDGLRVAVASSSKTDTLSFYVDLLHIRDVLDCVTSADEAKRSKPCPDIFAAALNDLLLPAERAIMVGDTPYDAEAACKLGAKALGVLCGGFSEQELRSAGAAEVYKDPADLLAHYTGSAPLPFA